MFEAKIRKNLKEGEEIIVIIKKYPLVFIGPIIISAVFIIAPFFFLYPLFHQGLWGVILFFILLLSGITFSIRQFVIYSFNIFVITNQRIIDIDQKGFFDRTVSESTYDKIQDVSFRLKGVFQTMFHYGSIIIQTAGTQANLELSGIKDPEKVQDLITKLQREFSREKSKELSASELIEMVKKIKEGLGEEKLKNLLEK